MTTKVPGYMLGNISTLARGDVLYYNGTNLTNLGAGTDGQFLKSQGSGADPLWGTIPNDILIYQDQKASGTAGNAYTADTWNTVILNTEVVDTAAIGSVASNAVTLPAGSYEFCGSVAPGTYTSGNAQVRVRLRNTSDSSTVIQSVNQEQPGSSAGQQIQISGQFTTTASKTFELQLYPTDTTAGATGVTSGEVEVYSSIIFRRYAT